MSKKIGVVIGRFQPLHAAHVHLLKTASENCDLLIVLIGDTCGPRTFKNPFTFQEREAMVRAAFGRRPAVFQLPDVPYNDGVWCESVRNTVKLITEPDDEVTIFGYEKDASSAYLRWFPGWEFMVVAHSDLTHLDATTLRETLFQPGRDLALQLKNHTATGMISKDVAKIISDIPWSTATQLIRERAAILDFERQWECPATDRWGPVVQCAVDCLVRTKDNDVLLIERGGDVGNGQLAIPGGFINPSERLYDAALRELKEETSLDLAALPPDFWRCERRNVAFDSPGRSMRGRIVTHATLIEVKEQVTVKAADDAASAVWMPYARLPRDRMFADHWHIINMLIKGETP